MADEKDKGGRPPLPDNLRKKNRTFRLSQDTLDKLEWLAAEYHDDNVTVALESSVGAQYLLAHKPGTQV